MENLDEALAGEGGGIGAGGVGRAEEGVGGLFVEAVEGFGFEGVELGVEAEGGAEGEEDVGVDGVGAGGTDELGGLVVGGAEVFGALAVVGPEALDVAFGVGEVGGGGFVEGEGVGGGLVADGVGVFLVRVGHRLGIF